MKTKSLLKSGLPLFIMLVSLMLVSCAQNSQSADSEGSDQAAVSAPAVETSQPAAAEESTPGSVGYELYQGEPQSIKPIQCGSCHRDEYKKLQNSNSKHRFDCLKCHTKLHAYIPTKNNYKDIMPKCARCHGLKHGEAFPNCLQCHTNPHTPLDIPFEGVQKKIRNAQGKKVVACEVCHWNPEGKEMADHPCKHNTEVGCTGCHITGINATKHGMKPTCFACHEPHIAGQTYQDCLVCHRPHSAKNILQYPEDTDNRVCGSCHTTIYQQLQTNQTKHTELFCADCHERHGQIPKCQKCHGEPHGSEIHQQFPNCLKCHIDPHNLPVNP